MSDVQVDSSTNPQSFRVFIKCSKTDPFHKGCFIFLGRGSFPLCPVVSLTNYLHLRGPGTGPLFIYQNGTPLSRSQLSSFLQTTLQSAGIPGKFSGHSFRIGAATTAARKGLPDHLINTMGHWSSEAYLLNVRTPVETSFLSQDNLLSRYELIYPSFGLLFWVPSDLGISLWGSGVPGHQPPFSPSNAKPARRSSGLEWGSWLGFLDLPAMGGVSIWVLAANSGSSWMSQAPNLHFVRQLLNAVKKI